MQPASHLELAALILFNVFLIFYLANHNLSIYQTGLYEFPSSSHHFIF